jgi:hypothetical protein
LVERSPAILFHPTVQFLPETAEHTVLGLPDGLAGHAQLGRDLGRRTVFDGRAPKRLVRPLEDK